MDTVKSAVNNVKAVLAKELEGRKKLLERVPEVRERKQAWYQAMEKEATQALR